MPTIKRFPVEKKGKDTADSSPLAIRKQLTKLLNSPEFHATDAQRAFLKYVVEKTLADQADIIKGYTIATQVFGRDKNFDQARDPIVSIQANKLRRALERYYLVEGQRDKVFISIPKGSYVPIFNKQDPPTLPENGIKRPNLKRANTWPTILVQSFDNNTENRELDFIGVGIATEIALEITRVQEIRVLCPEKGTRNFFSARARFMLSGSLKKSVSANLLKVIVTLTDLTTGIEIWADSYRTNLNPDEIITFEEKIAKTITGKILCEYGIIAKTLSQESARIPPANLKTHQAMLRFYNFSLVFSDQAFEEAYEALQQACREEPECGLAWSMLARLYAINYSLELFDVKTPLDEGTLYAQKGVQLEPENQRVRLHYAYILLLKNEISAGLAEVNNAFDLNHNSLIYCEYIGYLMTLFGDWHQGVGLIRKAIKENPYYNRTVHYALWLDWVRQGRYDLAYEETFHFSRPTLFWDPLLKTASLGLLGRDKEAKQLSNELFRHKPDFLTRGHVLIEHYIKHKNLVTSIISGLKKAGVNLK